MGYASSPTRDLRCFDDPEASKSSVEDGYAKGIRLGNIKVMVADVQGEDDGAGKIAFSPFGMAKRVEKERWYD
jgi:hypothetical protein